MPNVVAKGLAGSGRSPLEASPTWAQC